MRPKFHASLMTIQQIKAEVIRRGWEYFRSKVYDDKLYIVKMSRREFSELPKPRLRLVK